jgi:5-methylcytosine-specific restriction endonuclease McrA
VKPQRRRLVLGVVATDSTYERAEVRGRLSWVGKCLHCNRKLVVSLDGDTTATIEHCIPQNHGGGNDLENLALACENCNRQKGYRHDLKKPSDPRAREVIDALKARRMERWREAEGSTEA